MSSSTDAITEMNNLMAAVGLAVAGVSMLGSLWIFYMLLTEKSPAPTALPQPTPQVPGIAPVPIPAPTRKRRPRKGRRQRRKVLAPPRPRPLVNVLLGDLSPVSGSFHADECFNGKIVKRLQRHGFDVTTSAASRLLRAPDPRQLAFARKERRVLLTHDRDFLALHEQGYSHAGIIHVPKGEQWGQEVLRICLDM